ncbi:MAG TPA: ferrous iron transport protein A [Firmicutes bacterium]|nr:ferrous iron transport protein A [Bacillota bacterium]
MGGESMRPTLAHLAPGSEALVTALGGEGAIRRRLLDLGLVPGTRVKALRTSPLGDPKAYQIRGAVIALRAEEASLIAIRPLDTAQPLPREEEEA